MNKTILPLFIKRNKLRSSTLYHLLHGKRTSSVLLFGYFHEILPFLGIYPKLSPQEFQNVLQGSIAAGWVDDTDGLLSLTKKGQQQREELLAYSLTDSDFFSYGRSDIEAWNLIKLAVQTVSNLQARNKQFVPVQSNIFLLQRVKRWLLKKSRMEVITQLPIELATIFTELPTQEADFLANQFSGYQLDGFVNFQLSELSKELQYLVEHKNIHLFLKALEGHPDFLLYELVEPIIAKNYNQSMWKTVELLKQNCDLVTIQKVRQLKKGTVQDHVIEWAILDEHFPFAHFLSKDTEEMLKLQSPPETWQYKEVNQEKPIDYLEFRLYQIQCFQKRMRRHA